MKKPKPHPSHLKQKGQALIEYVLLLSIAVSLALLIVTRLVRVNSDSPESSGSLIRKWQCMQEVIAKDHPDKPNQPSPCP